MAITYNGAYTTQQTNAASVTITGTPVIGDCIICYCLSNQGTPSIADTISGGGSDTFSSVYGPFGPTGGSRNYSLYMAYTANIPSTNVRTIVWTGAASGQITGSAIHVGGLATVTPYNSTATPTVGLGNSTALSSNLTNATAWPNAIVVGVCSVDTSSAVTWTYGNVAGVAAQTSSATAGGSGSAPNILLEYNIVSSTGNYAATASSSISSHWLDQVFIFTDTSNTLTPNPPLMYHRKNVLYFI